MLARWGTRGLVVLLIAALAAIPFVTDQQYLLNTIMMIFLFSALGIAWNFIGGYAAQLSLGHAVFLSLGAYTTIILYTRYHISPIFGMFVGAAVAMVAALIIGYPCFRLRGPYFTLSTIAFGEILRILLLHYVNFTGGANGLLIPYKGQSAWNLQFDSKAAYYYIVLFMLIAVYMFGKLITGSRIGMYLQAIRDDQDAAESLGVKTHNVKLVALLISAGITGIMGAMYACVIGFVDPGSVGSITMSIQIALVAIVGGVGTLAGPIVGAAVVTGLTEATNSFFGAARTGTSMTLYGALLMIIVLTRPAGLISLVELIKWPKKPAKANVEVASR
ncbi:MAG TPA: branched-chain amino acid ABC transporter permease [Symbiobacteriaceae bacterium]|jgi:branched-chain amino acid transport system permease protein